MRIIFYLLLGVMFSITSNAQSFWFGPKLGPGLGFQKWNDTDNDPLLGINGDIFIESYSEEGSSSFFASLGYRTRGSSWRTGSLGSQVSFNAIKFQFNNAALEVGVKKFLFKNLENRPFYYIGLRGEYNLGTNLAQYQNTLFFPQEAFVKKLVYGPSFGGGYEFNFRELSKFFIELNLSTDLNPQYFQPQLFNIPDPFFPGQLRTLSERDIRNFSFEVKFGFKFLRKVVYE